MPIDHAIQQLYIAYTGRPADKFGFNFWDAIAASSGLAPVKAALAGSPEFMALMAKSSLHVVESVFQNLFGRLPDAATREFWMERLTHQDMALELFVGEMIAAATPADAEVLAIKTAAAASYTTALDLLTDTENLLLAPGRLQSDGQAYLAAVKDMPTLDAALTGLFDRVDALPLAADAGVPVPPVALDPMSMTQEIQRLYIAYFGRPADPNGFDYWEAIIANHGMAPIRSAFTQSAEFRSETAGLSHAAVVNQVYLNAFGRSAELAGLAYWVDLLAKGSISIEQVVESVLDGAVGADALVLRNKVVAATSLSAASAAVDVIPFWTQAEGARAKAFLAEVISDATLETMLGHVVETVQVVGGPAPIPQGAAFF